MDAFYPGHWQIGITNGQATLLEDTRRVLTLKSFKGLGLSFYKGE